MTAQYLAAERKGDVVVLRFHARVNADAYTTPAIASDLQSLGDPGREKAMVLDLANLDYASSAFLGTLIAWYQDAEERGVRLRLCAVNPRLLEVFRLVNLDRFIPIDAGVEEALRALRAGDDPGR